MTASKHIFLVGFMASGKSYLGRRLAQALELPFIDLDHYIESRLGMSISDYFSQEGEFAFRREESQALRTMTKQPVSVIACGGGTPCQDGNMDWMNTNGITIFLDTSQPILLERLQKESAQRPLVAQQANLADYLSHKLAERRPIYEQAAVTVSIEDTTTEIVSLLKALLSDHS